MTQCNTCNGTGHAYDLLHPQTTTMFPCLSCNGKGQIPDDIDKRKRLGRYLRTTREEHGYSLRDQSDIFGVPVTIVSAMERGWFDEALTTIGSAVFTEVLDLIREELHL